MTTDTPVYQQLLTRPKAMSATSFLFVIWAVVTLGLVANLLYQWNSSHQQVSDQLHKQLSRYQLNFDLQIRENLQLLHKAQATQLSKASYE